MTTRKLDRARWREYFDHVSKHLAATTVEIGIAGLDPGVQHAAEHLRLVGIAYDPSDESITISSEDLEHRIDHPREVLVEEEGTELRSLEVIDSGGHTRLVQLTRALPLPATTR
jgi:hypothetical protein